MPFRFIYLVYKLRYAETPLRPTGCAILCARGTLGCKAFVFSPSSVTLSTTEPNRRTSVLPSLLPPRPLSLLRPAGPESAKPRTRYTPTLTHLFAQLLNRARNLMRKQAEMQFDVASKHKKVDRDIAFLNRCLLHNSKVKC